MNEVCWGKKELLAKSPRSQLCLKVVWWGKELLAKSPRSQLCVRVVCWVPSKPLNVTVMRVTSTCIDLSWYEPEHPNGQIKGYRLYYIYANYTDVKTVRSTTPYIEFVLSDLKPYTDYKIWLKAFTWKNEGDSSEAILHKTDISGPSAPRILNLTCQSHDTLFLQWQRPSEFFHTIDLYYISYRDESSWEYEEIIVETSQEHLESMILISNLTVNTVYEVKVKGASRSIFNQKELIQGQFSEPKKVKLRQNCDKIQTFMQSSAKELSAGMIAGVVCVVLFLVLAIIALILWRKCFRAAYYYLDDPPRAPPPTIVDWTETGETNTAVSMHLFSEHVKELHADGDIGFSKEYEAIQAASTQEEYSTEHSQHPDNKTKNRYLNILAYDHSRVQLLPVPGQKKSVDYINANYIDGFQCSRAYIGTQGPLPATFDCFWRMVWEQRVAIIVMITNLVERGRIKKKKHVMSERFVYQYHYTNWPDHGTPDHPLPVLSFVKKSSAANPVDAGPIIVHCSAGVGRTGTYIVLDAMLKQIRSKGEVNIFGFLRHIRTQRNFLVQTEEQYIFIHDALLEAIESGETNISQTYLSRYIQTLQSSATVEEKDEKMEPWKMLESQCKLVTSFQPKDFNLVSANKPCNQVKNRTLELLPMENARVHLTPKPGVDGSDYINATWFQGFNKLREFIVTQHPLEATVLDFWQMVWDHNAQTVVLLSNLDDQHVGTYFQEFGNFWPSNQEDIDAEHFKVKFVEESEHVGYSTRDFIVQSVQDDYALADDYLLMYRALKTVTSSASSGLPTPAPPDLYLTANGHINGFVGNGNGNIRVPPEGMEAAAASARESLA
uniref:Protein-tyrosine-phosphatase n=1 Tax=Timema shepardi TaxID=629360 RepID=A0A7R9FY21_TIMSH|nr:unnamed protein product [Timema shepardi]